MNEDINKINQAKAEGNIDALKEIQETAEMIGEGEIAGLAEKAILEIQNIAENAKTTNSEANQVKEHGGDVVEIDNRTENVNKKIEETKTSAEQQITEVKEQTPNFFVSESTKGGSEMPDLDTPKGTKFDLLVSEDGKPIEKQGFLTEKAKEDNFNAFQELYLKYKGEAKKEYNISELGKNFEINQKPEEVNKILESLPRDVIEKITKDPENYIAIDAILRWKAVVGSQIGNLSNKRINFFDYSNKNELVVLGTMPNNPKDYLNITANAARFVPKEVSDKFVKDAVDAFVDRNKRLNMGNNSDDNPFVGIFNEKSFDVVRNLCESGYKDEAKKLLLSSYAEESKLSLKSRVEYGGNSRLLFKLSEEGVFSQDEIKEILDKSGYLEEPKAKESNESWG